MAERTVEQVAQLFSAAGDCVAEISKSKRAAYSSSKFGLIGLTKAVALDLF